MGESKKILVVEDDADIRETISELLVEEGYEVELTQNGQEALDYLLDCSALPHLILLDLMMPIMDGIEFCFKTSQQQKIAHIPVVIMSADGHLHEKIQKIGACDALKKPLDIHSVIEVIQRYILT